MKAKISPALVISSFSLALIGAAYFFILPALCKVDPIPPSTSDAEILRRHALDPDREAVERLW